MKTIKQLRKMAEIHDLDIVYKEVLRYGKILADMRGTDDVDRNLLIEYNGFFVETYTLLGETKNIQISENKPRYWDILIDECNNKQLK